MRPRHRRHLSSRRASWTHGSGSWPLGLRRSSLLGEGEPHGAEQDEVPASRTPCPPTFSAFAGEQEWLAA